MPTNATLMQPSSLYQIDPLTSDNYSAWKERIHWILLEQDLLEHISGQAVKPELADSQTVINPEKKKVIADWMKRSTGTCSHQSLD